MATGAYVQGTLFGRRTRTIVVVALAAGIALFGWLFYRGAEPPSFEEQYRTLMGAELMANTEFEFVRMSSPDTLEEATDKGSTTIYGHFDGPGHRDVVVYWLFESDEAARETFDQQREHYADQPGANFHEFGGEGMWARGDFKITTANHARYVTYKDNVIIMGESWRADPADVENRILEQQADVMIRAAYKSYLRLFGN